MKHARRLLLEAAVVAPSPIRAPPVAVAANQDATPGGTAPPDADSDSSSTSPFYVNSHFTPTMIIILVILSSAFFFMALFAVYVRRCTSEEGLSRRSNSRHTLRRDGFDSGSGVDPLLVESYPMVSYAAAKKKGCYECPVCLVEFEGGDELKQLPKCKHVFHPGCIGLWLESHTTCPLCRRSLVNSDRWSLSFRWGGSSRGDSLSTRRNGEESSRSRRREGTASSRFGRAGSSTGWFGRNGDGSRTGMSQHETSIPISDANAAQELESQALPTSSPTSSQRGMPASNQLSEVAPRVTARRLAPGELSESVMSNLSSQGIQASSFFCGLMPREIEEGSAGSDLMPRVYQSSEVAAGGLHAGTESTELAKNVLGRKPRRKLSRSNSTGHSLRRRAALQVTGCMPFSLHRSRSVGVDGVDDTEAMVGAACATSEHDPLSGSSCSSQIPQEPCHVSTSASTPP